MHASCAFCVLRYPPALAVISMLVSLLLAELTFFVLIINKSTKAQSNCKSEKLSICGFLRLGTCYLF